MEVLTMRYYGEDVCCVHDQPNKVDCYSTRVVVVVIVW
jgi:hypothetical protein